MRRENLLTVFLGWVLVVFVAHLDLCELSFKPWIGGGFISIYLLGATARLPGMRAFHILIRVGIFASLAIFPLYIALSGTEIGRAQQESLACVIVAMMANCLLALTPLPLAGPVWALEDTEQEEEVDQAETPFASHETEDVFTGQRWEDPFEKKCSEDPFGKPDWEDPFDKQYANDPLGRRYPDALVLSSGN